MHGIQDVDVRNAQFVQTGLLRVCTMVQTVCDPAVRQIS